MKSVSLTNFSGLIQSSGQGNRSPWTVFWILVVIAILAVVISWFMNRGKKEEEAPTTDRPAAAPPIEPVAAQAVPQQEAPAKEPVEPAKKDAEESEPIAEAEAMSEEEEVDQAIDDTVTEEEPAKVASSEEKEMEEPSTEEEVSEAAETKEPAGVTEEAVAEEVAPDDLTRVEGIGSKISGILQENGIATFAQLAGTDVEKLRQIMLDAKLRIANPETWPEQAALAAAGKWDELDKLQDSLKSGRRVGTEADDLTHLEGIGPKIAGLLNEAGITTYKQLSKTDVDTLRQIMLDAKLRIANPETWPEQATLAAAGKWDELDKMQGSLKGGRKV